MDDSNNGEKSEPSFAIADEMESSRVMSARAARKKNSMEKADPSNVYKEHEKLPRSKPFGPKTLDGRPLFTYTKDGQLAEDRVYSKEDLQTYLDARRSVLWIQQSPSQCASRLHFDDRRCRWDKCPLASRVIGSGWFRVAFDEHPELTTKGSKDPFKVAGIMHLWCFEQCFDIVDFFKHDRVRADTRILPRETGNAMSINRDSDREIVKEAFDPWFKERKDHMDIYGPETLPRQHHDTLSYRLSRHHVESQTGARQKARDTRNKGRPWKERTTIDVHMGDLQVYVSHSNHKKNAKRRKTRAGGEADKDGRAAERRSSGLVGGGGPVVGMVPTGRGVPLAKPYASLPEPHVPRQGTHAPRPEPHIAQLEPYVPRPQSHTPQPMQHAPHQELNALGSRHDGFDEDAFPDLFQLQAWQSYTFDEPDSSNSLLTFANEQTLKQVPTGTTCAAAMTSQVLDQTPVGERRASMTRKQTPAGAEAATANPRQTQAATSATANASKRGRTDDGPTGERDAKIRHLDENPPKRKRDDSDEVQAAAAEDMRPKRLCTGPSEKQQKGHERQDRAASTCDSLFDESRLEP
ncbi:hypothetical protein XA68_17771 [Ophiocordyceps unilateralis]|uniref:Uncharacterized protein n=1 Tax=Ophiocordyceps unilateralis TaxID=268505 RepID=A0A2A9PSA0_OPHUN|nr:hypothetical protein XA68_17771 [Ophiocordyceps unilateralis]